MVIKKVFSSILFKIGNQFLYCQKFIAKRIQYDYGLGLFSILTNDCKSFIKNIVHSMLYYGQSNDHVIPENVKTIEFICFGNICRSAFAEKYANALIKRRGWSLISTSSGLFAKDGTGSPEEALIAGSLFKVDLSDHYSKKTTIQTITDADLVICMHYNHFKKLRKKFPSCKNKIFLLKAFNRKINFNVNIEDPYGKKPEVFIECFKDITKNIDYIVKQIEITKSPRSPD